MMLIAPSKKEGHRLESLKIHELNTLEPNGYNVTAFGAHLKEQHVLNIRAALRQPDVRKTISEKLTIISNKPEMRKKRATFAGKHHTQQSRDAIGKSHMGKKQSPEHIEALAVIRRGRIWVNNGTYQTTLPAGSSVPLDWEAGCLPRGRKK
jgi:hypothetical protein